MRGYVVMHAWFDRRDVMMMLTIAETIQVTRDAKTMIASHAGEMVKFSVILDFRLRNLIIGFYAYSANRCQVFFCFGRGFGIARGDLRECAAAMNQPAKSPALGPGFSEFSLVRDAYCAAASFAI